MTPEDGIDPRVIRAKVDAAGTHDAGQQIQDMRTYAMRMALVTGAAVLLVVAGLLVPDHTLALGLWTGAAIGVLAALVFARPKRRTNQRGNS
jgi:low temperature requirement protein LtrA